MVNEPDAMKKYFVRNSDIFSNRWRNYVTDTFMGGVNGVVQIDGDKWREQRRFSLHVLRDFGVGRALMEHTIQLEVMEFIEYLTENSGKELDLCRVTAVCVGNIINNILFGNRFPQGSAEFHHLHGLLDEQSRLVISPIMGAYIAAPWLTTIPLINTKWKHLLTIREQLWAYLDIQVNEHKEKFDADERPTDFTYSYMKEMHRRKIEGNHPGFFDNRIMAPNVWFREWQMKMLLLDLFFAGMETTEIQRVANILPINLLRTVAEDVYIDKYFYPAGTMCIPQISIAMNDPKNFYDPKTFRPERFLQDDAKTMKR
uniref:Cytochrome P450 n=1 Tax=Parascaris univalens TaxID=6257 RepID=A0A914ZS01_PARUN